MSVSYGKRKHIPLVDRNGLPVSDTSRAISAARTLTNADSGVYTVAKTSVYTITLPAPQQGLRFKFIAMDTGNNDVTIAAPSTYLNGSFSEGAVTTGVAAKTNIVFTGANAIGDWIEVEGITSALYLVSGSAATAGDITSS